MLAELNKRLTEAQAAYHDLMTGRSVVSVTDQNGERVQYTPASATRLNAYIIELQRQISGLTGCGRTSGPMRVFF